MTFKMALFNAAFSAAILLGGAAVAAPISPTFTSFGTLTGATFGGSGIPNTAVAIATSTGDLTLGLTAHQRLVGPNLANNGAGTFTAFTGVSTGPPSPGDPYATWNFGFYIGGLDISDLRFVLEYDFNAAAGNDASTHGTISVAGIFVPTNPSQDSYNLGMDFLTATNPAFGIVAPGGIFNPDAAGEYTFRLTAFSGGPANVIAAQTAIRVNVVDQQQVPEPASLALVGMALLGAAAARRRMR